MYTETTIEWWKLRIYQETSEFLNNPSAEKQARLNIALESYQAFCLQHKPLEVTPYDSDNYKPLISA